ncbi:H-type small acid-soluble spore protein [Romboutsia sp.]|uniref:H-type small acid-soluble spore protein n=1 Tax=Romboutsia sp. TaxID=1965302 RepID=UPI002C992876|nr:H-type small acid-soluble spore protein [Romboutsia sp.]HSQ87503.1 H-type small acid-soluble spore protein [Romboutsia sp.]
MQLRRAAEILNSNENNNTIVYYQNNPVIIVSVDNNIGTAYVKSVNDDNNRFEVDLEQLIEKNQ